MTIPSKAASADGSAGGVPAFHVGGRRNGNDVQGRERAGHHAWRQLDAAADRSVESLGNQVDLPAFELPVGTDLRVSFQELRQQRHDVIDPEGQAHADLEHAGRLGAVRGDARNRRLQLLQMAPDPVQETLAGFGQGQLPSAAVEQPNTKVSLQDRDVSAHGGRSER